MVLPDEYVSEDGTWARRIWCWLFHRRHWEYMTWGGAGFHHMNHCTSCGEDWPERLPNVPNIPSVPPPPPQQLG